MPTTDLVARAVKTSLKVDNELNRTYTSVYRVSNAPLWASPLEIIEAQGIPNYAGYWVWDDDFDEWAGFQDLSCDIVAEVSITDPDTNTISRGRDWEVTVVHSTKGSRRDQLTPRGDPTLEPPIISGSFVSRQSKKARDKDGNPIVNTALMPYDPPIQTDDSIDSLNIQYNTPFISLVQRAEFRDTVNSAPIWGLQARQVKLARWNYSVKYVVGIPYIAHQFEFLINYNSFAVEACNIGGGVQNYVGWNHLLPNRGHSELVSGEQVPITYQDVKKEEPSKLNCDGTKADDDADETWNVFKVEGEKDFRTIPGMPNPLPGPFV